MTTTFPAPTTSRHRRSLLAVSGAALTALALVAFMVTSVTRAAWTDTTENAGNAWATGTVSLTDDDGGTAMFSATDMLPGDVETNSITVTNDSSVPLDVRLYGQNLAETDGLAQYLNLKIGTAVDGYDVYDAVDGTAGTLSGFSTAHANFANGTPVISLAPAATQTYYFWVELDSEAPDGVQGASAGIDFVWEGHTQS